MQTIPQPVPSGPVVVPARSEGLSVRTTTPAEVVAVLLTTRQLGSVPVVDEYGVPVGSISMADLLAGAGGADPFFAGSARRRWYQVPAATAADLMARPHLPASRRAA